MRHCSTRTRSCLVAIVAVCAAAGLATAGCAGPPGPEDGGRASTASALVPAGADGPAANTAVAAGDPTVTPGDRTRLRAVATTSIVGDVVSRVGGDRVELTVLLPLGADPHGFEARPRDAEAIADADLVFANGLGLEPFLAPLLAGTESEDKLVEVSRGVDTISLADAPSRHDGDLPGGGVDPHVWLDPRSVEVWVDNISTALGGADPVGAETYAAQADAYRGALEELDAWIGRRVAEVPAERRKLVTDHQELGYFARRYGFEEVGSLVESFSTLAQPSAGALAALEERVRSSGASAVLVGASVNSALAERVAADTGMTVVRLHTGSLGDPGGPAGDYISLMRSNVDAIVEALR